MDIFRSFLRPRSANFPDSSTFSWYFLSILSSKWFFFTLVWKYFTFSLDKSMEKIFQLHNFSPKSIFRHFYLRGENVRSVCSVWISPLNWIFILNFRDGKIRKSRENLDEKKISQKVSNEKKWEETKMTSRRDISGEVAAVCLKSPLNAFFSMMQ